MKQLSVLICISHIFFSSEKKKNKELYGAFEGTWLFDQMLKGAGVPDLKSLPGNIILNSNSNKTEGNGIWISKNRDEAHFTWSISESGHVFTLTPLISSSIQNQATDALEQYKGRYTIESLDATHLILEKSKVIIKFKRYIAE